MAVIGRGGQEEALKGGKFPEEGGPSSTSV